MTDENQYIRSPEEVQEFLEKVYELSKCEETSAINMQPWSRKVNKTLKFMTERGLSGAVIRNLIQELTVENYSATKPELNVNFTGEIWEFGMTKNIVDKEEDLYIKMKIEKCEDSFLLIMSFHPEEPLTEDKRLKFPYAKK